MSTTNRPRPPAATPASCEAIVEEEIVRLLEELGAARGLAAVGPAASLDRDLGLGSLERVELVSRLEARLGVRLGDEVLARAETVRDLAEAVAASGGRTILRVDGATVVPTRLAPPADATSLVEVLRRRAEAEPERPHLFLLEDAGSGASSARERTIRYGELYRDGLAVAGALLERGVRRGETVALMLPTSRDFYVAYAGVLLAGAVPVPLYPPFRLDRIAEFAERQVRILRAAAARAFLTVGAAESLGELLRGRVPTLRFVATVDALVADGLAARPVEATGDEPALVQYTSGSTGEPKGVLLTHRNLLANIRAIEAALDVRPSDVGVSWLPLYHDMGLIGCWLAPLYLGVPMTVFSPLAFLSRPERWLWTIHARRATVSAAPNFAYELAVRKIPDEALEGLDLSCWRAALNGAEPVSAETIERFVARFAPFGFRAEALLPVYGLAESSLALTVPPLGRPPRIEAVARRPFETEGRAVPAPPGERRPLRFVSCGRPVPGHEIRIVGAEGTPLGERREGRLEFRGPSTMQGYFRDPEATARVLRPGGWVDSGDRGFVADGELFVTGRDKDLIIRAGRNLYPQEIEEIVAEVEGVRRGCVAAFAAVDERRGTERLVVVAETRVGKERQDALARAVQERLVDLLGTPADDVVLVPPGTIPKTSSGKLRRAECRRRYEEGSLVRRRAWLAALRLAAAEARVRLRRAARGLARLAYGAYVYALSAAMLLAVYPVALVSRDRRRLARFVRAATSLYLRLIGCRVEAAGTAHLEPLRGEAVVFVSNHASYLDPLPLLVALDVDLAFVVKKEAARWPVIGTFLDRLGHPPVERADPRESARDAERLASVLEAGRSLFFFPEGTFRRATGLRPFRLGAFWLAARHERPVVPVALVGTRRWLRDGTWIPRPTRLRVVVGEPLRPREDSFAELVRLRDRAAELIAAETGEPRLDLVAGSPFVD